MSISTQIQWLADGERANALVLNRPLKKAVELIEQKFTELETNGGGGSSSGTGGSGFPKACGYVFAEGKIEASVQDLDFVYINTTNSNKVTKTTGADSKFIGVYNKVAKDSGGHEHRVITSGCVTMTGKSLEVGKDYYLSSTAGGISATGTIYVGTCIDNNILSIGSRASISSGGGSTSGTANIKEVQLRTGTKQYSVSYTPNKTMFFVEGVLLNSNMITAADGANVTLAFDPKTNDVLSVVSL